MQKKHVIQFAVFGGVMALIHLVQCIFRVKAHEVFLNLSASPSTANDSLLRQFENYGTITEVAYYTIGIIFIILIGYRLIYKKIRFRFALGATFAAYLVSALVGVIFRFQAQGVTNLMLPVLASFFFALLVVISAGVKRNQYQKIQEQQNK